MKEQALTLVTPFDKITKKVFLITLLCEWLLILTLWELNGSQLLPKPIGIFNQFITPVHLQDLFDNLLTSFVLTIKAILFGTLIACIISYAYFIGIFRPIVEFIIKVRYLPLTGIIFVFSLLSSNGSSLKLILLLFGIVPFFVTSMVSALSSINPQLYDLCKTLRMNRWQTLMRVVIVGKLDYVFEVMRQNFAICWLMITMVEGLSMSEGGIGTLLIKQNRTLELEYVFAIQLTLFLSGILFDAAITHARHLIFKHTRI